MTKAMTVTGKDEKSAAEEKRISDIVNFQNSFQKECYAEWMKLEEGRLPDRF